MKLISCNLSHYDKVTLKVICVKISSKLMAYFYINQALFLVS